MGIFDENSRNSGQTELNHALDAWRRAQPPTESLSAQARARILSNALDARRGRLPLGSLGSLFMPAWRALALGAVPAALLALALIVGSFAPQQPAGTGDASSLRLRAEKQGDQVVFLIANGGRRHVVQRSTAADGRVGSDRLSTSGGTFRDSLESGSDIVYYRID